MFRQRIDTSWKHQIRTLSSLVERYIDIVKVVGAIPTGCTSFEENDMKTFTQLTENINKPGSFEHFKKHARGYMKHGDRARVARSDRTEKAHLEKEQHHSGELMKHYGVSAFDNIRIDGGDDDAIKSAFDKLKK